MKIRQNALSAIEPMPPTREQMYQMQRDYHEASKPILKVLCDIESVTIHKLFIGPGGELRREENYSPENREARRRLMGLLEDLRCSIFHLTPKAGREK